MTVMIPRTAVEAAIEALHADTQKASERLVGFLTQNAGDVRANLVEQMETNNLWISVYGDLLGYLFNKDGLEITAVTKEEFNAFLFHWLVQLSQGEGIGHRFAHEQTARKMAVIGDLARDSRFGNRSN